MLLPFPGIFKCVYMYLHCISWEAYNCLQRQTDHCKRGHRVPSGVELHFRCSESNGASRRDWLKSFIVAKRHPTQNLRIISIFFKNGSKKRIHLPGLEQICICTMYHQTTVFYPFFHFSCPFFFKIYPWGSTIMVKLALWLFQQYDILCIVYYMLYILYYYNIYRFSRY